MSFYLNSAGTEKNLLSLYHDDKATMNADLTLNGDLTTQGDDAAASVGVAEILKLHRPLNPSESYPQTASFAVGTHDASGVAPNTRLDLKLKSTSTDDDTTDITAMTWLDTGNVGIGDTTPEMTLKVQETTDTEVVGVQNNIGALTSDVMTVGTFDGGSGDSWNLLNLEVSNS